MKKPKTFKFLSFFRVSEKLLTKLLTGSFLQSVGIPELLTICATFLMLY